MELKLTAHPPQLDKTVITCGDNQRQGRMNRHPVDAPIVALQDKLHNRISISEHICLTRVCSSHLVFEGERGRGRVLLSKSRNIPNAHGLVEGGGRDQVFLGVKLRAHYVVVVAGHGAD